VNKEELVSFEKTVGNLFRKRKIKCPIHLAAGNEEILINIFNSINKDDYVFSTHRNHFHYLLHTGNQERLMKQILDGDSMHTCDPENNFYSSSIVSGCVSIACGVAMALKMKGSTKKVWCFIGDGATDEGWFTEALRYAVSQNLPITYVVEDNNRSVCTSVEQRWGEEGAVSEEKIIYYKYECEYPHVGIGEWVTF